MTKSRPVKTKLVEPDKTKSARTPTAFDRVWRWVVLILILCTIADYWTFVYPMLYFASIIGGTYAVVKQGF